MAGERELMGQLERILWLDAEIRAERYPNAETVMEKFEVSRRTAFHDRDYLLLSLGAPLAYNRHHKGWYYTDSTYGLPAIIVSESELLSFALSQSLVAQYLGSPFAEAMSALLRKLIQMHPEGAAMIDGNADWVSMRRQSSISCSADLLSAVGSCIREHRTMRIVYYSAHRDEVNDREVEPLHLLNAQGEWHCIAWCRLRKGLRQFLLSRIQEWEVTENHFHVDPAFDVGAYIGRGLLAEHGGNAVEVVLRFSAYQARWIRERRWHSSQVLTEHTDGSLELRLTVTGLAEVKRWVLAYGGEVETIAPPELREAVATECARMQRIYEKRASS